MKWRQITEDEIVEVINNPSEETASIKGRVNLLGSSDISRLKVTIERGDDDIIVVTALRRGKS